MQHIPEKLIYKRCKTFSNSAVLSTLFFVSCGFPAFLLCKVVWIPLCSFTQYSTQLGHRDTWKINAAKLTRAM